MTTKYKIISGFLLILAILACVAVMGYRTIESSSSGFTEFQRLAHLNLTASDTKISLNRSAYHMYMFLDTHDSEFIKLARTDLAKAEAQLKEAGDYVSLDPHKNLLSQLSSGAKELAGKIGEVETGVLAGFKQYSDGVQGEARKVHAGLKEIAQNSRDAGNLDALFALNAVWDGMGGTHSVLGRYSISRSKADSERSHLFVGKVEKDLEQLDQVVRSYAGRQSYAAIMESFNGLKAALVGMDKENARAATALQDMSDILEKELVASDKIHAEVDAEMMDYGKAMLSSNASAQWNTAIISIAGIVLGICCAGFIIYGIMKVLKELAGFAGAVARGDFRSSLSVREKGEIGTMVDAIRQIPSVLEQVMSQADTLTKNILMGHFRDRLNTSAFSGSFADLATSVNTVGNAYTDVIDALPLPLLSCEKQHTLVFLNNAAQADLGGDALGTRYDTHFQPIGPESTTSIGEKTISGNSTLTSEISTGMRGKRMELIVSSMPLHDVSGQVVGYTQVINNVTEVKEKQNTIIQAAKEASEISDRVAAASEELSAQVEQVSRGAEMQRVRVESTASAMTEMNSTVLEVARNAGQASEQSNGTRKKAEDGAGLVNQVVQSINTVNIVATTLQDNMQELGKQAENIGGVMNVISDIADQTNLLALNAAIEAARAGEAGRGFAVVADEVRKLAEKTMSATQEVGANIRAIQNSTRTNISEVGNAVQNISEATDLANSSGDALKEIVSLASANSAIVASIAAAAEQQSATSEEINRAIEEINMVVGETSQGMIQSSAAVQDLSSMAQDLRRVMERLRS